MSYVRENIKVIEPEKWYSINQIEKSFGIHHSVLNKAIKKGDLKVIKFGRSTKTLGMEYMRYALKHLYGNKKRMEAALKLAGIKFIENKIVE